MMGNLLVGNEYDKVAVTAVFHPTSTDILFGISDEDASRFSTGAQRSFCIYMKDDPTNIWWANILSG